MATLREVELQYPVLEWHVNRIPVWPLVRLQWFFDEWTVHYASPRKLTSSAARLVGRLANICPDLPATDLVSTSVFKAITGGDPLVAEYKFRDSFEFIPYTRLVFSANHPPKSQDASPAFFRR